MASFELPTTNPHLSCAEEPRAGCSSAGEVSMSSLWKSIIKHMNSFVTMFLVEGRCFGRSLLWFTVNSLRTRNYFGFLDARADMASGGVRLRQIGGPPNSKEKKRADKMKWKSIFQGIKWGGKASSRPSAMSSYGHTRNWSFRRRRSPPHIPVPA